MMRAILFDINGTLLDNSEHVFSQFEQLTREVDGVPASRREIAEAMRAPDDEVLKRLIKNNQADFAKVQQRHNSLYYNVVAATNLFDGVVELLPILRQIGFRIAALTSGDYRLAEILEQKNIRQYFEIIVSDEHISQAKPDPAALLFALEHMGIAPQNATVVGDSSADIIAGKRAYVEKTVGVLHSFDRLMELQMTGADHIIQDIPTLLDVIE